MEKTKQRIEWIDVLRFLGIFSIYFTHLEEQVGYFHRFGYRYQVPLFFFIAGAMENLARTDDNFWEHFKKKFKGIMLPYFFFGLVSILIIFLEGKANAGVIVRTVVQYVLGIRNQLFAPMLWFLPCVFVMGLLFYLLKKLVKNRWLILVGGVGFLILTVTVFPHQPLNHPSWFWNIDSALYYFVYYALGYAVFPSISKLFSTRSVWVHAAYLVSVAFVSFYAMSLIVGRDLVAEALRFIPNSGPFIHVIGAILLIWFAIFLAQILKSIPLLQRVGRETLYLCGSEQVVRHFIPPLFSMLGWSLSFSSPIGATIYTVAIFMAAFFVVTPVLKKLYNAILEQLFPKGLQARSAVQSE